jgi:hypothetical protein
MKKGEPLQKKATCRLDALKDFVKLMPESVNSRYFNRGTNKGPPIVHLTFKERSTPVSFMVQLHYILRKVLFQSLRRVKAPRD